MPVSQSLNFLALNTFFPNKGRKIGEVVAISVLVERASPLSGVKTWDAIAYSKRKSIHVPVSSNAYWNWVNLRSEMVADFSLQGTSRADRDTLLALVNKAIRRVYYRLGNELTEGGHVGQVNQYFQFILSQGEPTGNWYCTVLGEADQVLDDVELSKEDPIGWEIGSDGCAFSHE